jgi:LacI family transcriptional regulator
VAVLMKDVAEAAQVSLTTVSLVLNNAPGARVSEETRRRVLAVAEELNYTPNSLARALARNRSMTLGLYVPFKGPIFFNHFLSEVSAGIQEVLIQNEYDLLLHSTDDEDTIPHQVVHSSRIDGLIVVTTRYCTPLHIDRYIEQLESAGMPFVIVNYSSPNQAVNCVACNLRRSVYEAISYIATMGRRKIMFVAGPKDAAVTIDNMAGYHEACKDMGLPFDEELVVDGGYNESKTYQLVTGALMGSSFRPDAIFAASDEMSIGALKAAKDRQFRIPEDISVVGSDDFALAAFLDPPLTAIRVPAYQMGTMAAEILLRTIEGETEPKQVVLDSELIIRRSCAMKR